MGAIFTDHVSRMLPIRRPPRDLAQPRGLAVRKNADPVDAPGDPDHPDEGAHQQDERRGDLPQRNGSNGKAQHHEDGGEERDDGRDDRHRRVRALDHENEEENGQDERRHDG